MSKCSSPRTAAVVLADHASDGATPGACPQLALWRASVRMAVITAASLGATALIATGMTGCADMSGIAPVAAVRSAASLGFNTAEEATAAVDAEWWRAFGDDALSGLITEALANNPSLKVAQARLARAQSAVDATRAADVPQVSGQVDITRQRYTETGLVPPPLAGAAVTNGTVQLAGSWELDFFGKNHAALNAALGTARAVQADGQAARLLLASQVARTYFNGLRLNEQAGLAQRTLAQRTETLKLVQDRVSAGLDTPLELRQSEGGLPEARLQFEALQEQIMLTRHALAALVGRPADVVAPVFLAQSAVKNMTLPAVIPADLLGRRADVAAARWRIEAAAGNVVNAKAQFYPNINLVAFAGFSSIGLGNLLAAGSRQAGIGPALRLPIFEGGRLRANLQGQTADLDAAIESYNAAVIDAVRDAKDQVASAQAIARQQTEQRSAQASAETAYDAAVQRYKAGLGNYLSVLTVETNVLRQRGMAVDLAARALDTQVALARALGGGYASGFSSGSVSEPIGAHASNAPELIATKAVKTRTTGTFD